MNKTERARVLVLGAGGMLGHAVFRVLAADASLSVVGTVRSARSIAQLPAPIRDRLLPDVDVENADSLAAVLSTRPTVVINCVGAVKQLARANEPLVALPLNALLPHRLAQLCTIAGARLIHISTDCVFSGDKGMYLESDPSDARDLYGVSKHLGEVSEAHTVTLRTSIIGHELSSAHGLVEWFLAQSSPVKGYRRAIFSGLPTVELAGVIRDHVISNPDLRGVYHVAAAPIAKLDLLELIAAAYGRQTTIIPDDTVKIDRSLDGSRFRAATGYVAPAWPELVRRMHEFR